jgi:D-alanyl-D-alanine carboxypeptidase/D-alanyl-D-alanine-endopeptidase (penicillin-binding protein 4)
MSIGRILYTFASVSSALLFSVPTASAPTVAPRYAFELRAQGGPDDHRKGHANKRKDSAHERFAARVESLLETGSVAKSDWGVLISDGESGETLFEQNADKYFVPASNMKLFTTAYALSVLGPDYRFRTTLETRGVIAPDGTLSADLVLVGRGDPNLSNRKHPFSLKEEFEGPPERVLAELAEAVVTAGVKSISGDIIGDDSFFPRERYPSGWEIADMVWEYGAAVSAIVVNDNTVTVTLTPRTEAGTPVVMSFDLPTNDFRVENTVQTSAANVKADLTLKREPGAGMVYVTGTLPANSPPRKLLLAVEQPALHAATLLQRLLEQRGVTVNGQARARHRESCCGDASSDSQTKPAVIAEHLSQPLSETLKLVNKLSQNLHTEVLLRTAAVESCRKAPASKTAPDCSSLPLDFFPQAPLDFYKAAGITEGDVVQTDGSGLSRHDLITPRAAVTLLRYAIKQPWFAPFYDSLPVAGIDGTLEDRLKNTLAAGHVHAKSGSVEHVRARSGYAETPSGRKLIFSFLANNQGGKSREAMDALDSLTLAMIMEFDGTPRQCCKK